MVTTLIKRTLVAGVALALVVVLTGLPQTAIAQNSQTFPQTYVRYPLPFSAPVPASVAQNGQTPQQYYRPYPRPFTMTPSAVVANPSVVVYYVPWTAPIGIRVLPWGQVVGAPWDSYIITPRTVPIILGPSGPSVR